ncbi:unnamed protein product [Boreogadus saida]
MSRLSDRQQEPSQSIWAEPGVLSALATSPSKAGRRRELMGTIFVYWNEGMASSPSLHWADCSRGAHTKQR